MEEDDIRLLVRGKGVQLGICHKIHSQAEEIALALADFKLFPFGIGELVVGYMPYNGVESRVFHHEPQYGIHLPLGYARHLEHHVDGFSALQQRTEPFLPLAVRSCRALFFPDCPPFHIDAHILQPPPVWSNVIAELPYGCSQGKGKQHLVDFAYHGMECKVTTHSVYQIPLHHARAKNGLT
ncbi:MAG: hypothetical protein Q4E43_07375 [Akkermansia sp.]|nr:hypothetical protein [Akkermansia sp.]